MFNSKKIKELEDKLAYLRGDLQKMCKHEFIPLTIDLSELDCYIFRLPKRYFKKCHICQLSESIGQFEYQKMVNDKELKDAKAIIEKYEPKKGVKRNAKVSV